MRTLDDLHSALEEKGFKLSRAATYYRLMPANVNDKDAKRHVNTVPVKLLRPRNGLRKKTNRWTFCHGRRKAGR